MMISVIIPAYNAEKHIKTAINSILSQTYQNFEILIINDGSTDHTKELLDSYHDDRIHVFHRKNHGVSASRNFGIRQARGEWLYFLDADDWLEKEAFDYSLSLYSNYDIIIWNAKDYHPDTKTFTNTFQFSQTEISVTTKEDKDYLLKMNFIQEYPSGHFFDMGMRNVWNRLMKRDLIIKNNLFFDETLKNHEDFLWALETLEYADSIISFDKPFYIRVIREGSASRKYMPHIIKNNWNAYKRLNNYLKQFHPQDDEYENAVKQYYTGWLERILVFHLFHPNSSLSFWKAYKKLKRLCQYEPYKSSFYYSLPHMSKGKRLFCFLGRRKMFFIISLVFWMKKFS